MLKVLAPIRDILLFLLLKAVGQKQWAREGNFDTLFHCPVYGDYGVFNKDLFTEIISFLFSDPAESGLC